LNYYIYIHYQINLFFRSFGFIKLKLIALPPPLALNKKQELDAASRAVLSVFPGAQIANKCKSHPMIVSIDAEVDGDDELVHVWDGDQKGLYRKYGHRAVPLIKEALLDFKRTVAGDEDADDK
jgi:hypothetical protein